jgi:hypothetical protein
MCAYKYGKASKTSNRATYNYESASGRKWLVQMNWDPVTQMCSMGDAPTTAQDSDSPRTSPSPLS